MKLAASKRAQAERELVDAVRFGRESDMSWEQIGTHIGITGEAVRRRYGDLVGITEDAMQLSIRRSVGKVPVGGKIGVSTSRSGGIEVSVLDTSGHSVRRIRKPQIVRAIAGMTVVVVRGERIRVERTVL